MERVIMLRETILLLETQIPWAIYIDSLQSLGLWATGKIWRGGGGGTPDLQITKSSLWTSTLAKRRNGGLWSTQPGCCTSGSAVALATRHILCWLPKWHIRTTGTVLTGPLWWGAGCLPSGARCSSRFCARPPPADCKDHQAFGSVASRTPPLRKAPIISRGLRRDLRKVAMLPSGIV